MVWAGAATTLACTKGGSVMGKRLSEMRRGNPPGRLRHRPGRGRLRCCCDWEHTRRRCECHCAFAKQISVLGLSWLPRCMNGLCWLLQQLQHCLSGQEIGGCKGWLHSTSHGAGLSGALITQRRLQPIRCRKPWTNSKTRCPLPNSPKLANDCTDAKGYTDISLSFYIRGARKTESDFVRQKL
jgi:hypothetical protein